ncbi:MULTISPECIES: hypothetical protein [Spirosoma]|uniref:Uncharacterized protein n=1 Tax=Spirosoma liriopis TaxID=2937440 RepID=A0ABT0HQX1_9BACT|nr:MULTISPECIES: hypothetical protein [Spirosoma]MCK8494578.1 hypothetical protein [Spirosoma liriopis]UHG89578.1 hypothetical protein LQ777_15135 [Spirosoma oryzicola]
MSQESENLKVIFYQPAAEGERGTIVADGYFSFVPTFKAGDAINITLSKPNAADPVVHDPIGHKTHHVQATDWVIMIDENSKQAVATLIVSVSSIEPTATSTDYPSIVATH